MWWYCVIRMKYSNSFIPTRRKTLCTAHARLLLLLQCSSCDFVSLWLANMISIRHIRWNVRLPLARLMAYWHTPSYTRWKNPLVDLTCWEWQSSFQQQKSSHHINLFHWYEEMKRGEWDYMSIENIKAKYEYDDEMKWLGDFINVRGLTF